MEAGQNAPVGATQFDIAVGWDTTPAGYDVDLSCFALDAHGKVRSDDDFVFFNSTRLAGGGVSLDLAARSFGVNLAAVPADVEKLAFALTLSQGPSHGHSVAGLGCISVTASAQPQLAFRFSTDGREEAAVTLCEVYRRAGEWKFRALGQGFIGGLKPLAERYGVMIDADEDAAASVAATPSRTQDAPDGGSAPAAEAPLTPAAPAAPPASAAPPAPPAAAAPPAPAAPLGPPARRSSAGRAMVTLEHKGESVALEPGAGGSGEIVLNLNWTSGAGKRGLLGRKKGVDLDLGCLFELADGRKGMIQALGNRFGSYAEAPWIALDADDRSGSSAGGETIRINGSHWSGISRVLVYAFIYEGTPNWEAAGGVATLRMPGLGEVQVRMDSSGSRDAICAIAMLENVVDTVKCTKVVEYYRAHKQMDKACGWGLKWVEGSKD